MGERKEVVTNGVKNFIDTPAGRAVLDSFRNDDGGDGLNRRNQVIEVQSNGLVVFKARLLMRRSRDEYFMDVQVFRGRKMSVALVADLKTMAEAGSVV